jgi:hypothetical protein
MKDSLVFIKKNMHDVEPRSQFFTGTGRNCRAIFSAIYEYCLVFDTILHQKTNNRQHHISFRSLLLFASETSRFADDPCPQVADLRFLVVAYFLLPVTHALEYFGQRNHFPPAKFHRG